MVVGHFLRILKFFGENQIANLRKIIDRVGVVVIMRAARPKTGFVQRNAFLLDAAKNHRAHIAIAHRHGVEPFYAGLAIADNHVASRRNRTV